MRSGVLAAMLIAAVFVVPAADARPVPEKRSGGRLCKAMKVEGTGPGQIRSIVEYDSAWAARHVRRLGRNGAFWITVDGRASCKKIRMPLANVLLARDEVVALQSHGWRVLAVDRLRVDGVAVHRVIARKARQGLSYVRPGGAPPVDRAGYRAGQTLSFDRSGTTCTSAFVLRLRSGELAGLSAGHCSKGPVDAPPQYPGGPPIYVTDTVSRVQERSTAITLGPVFANMDLSEHGPDGLLFTISGVPFAAQQVDRGARRPHRVTGMLPMRLQRKGRVVCYTGAVTGVDRCGRIHGASTWFGRYVICARGRHRLSDHGDSGGPVYTRPRHGRVRAVGIVTRSSVGGRLRDMCYTPIQHVLEGFAAKLPTGSFAIGG